MPKNTKGGNKAKKGKNQQETKELIIREKNDFQQYAKITKMLGNCRVEVKCLGDNKTRLAHIRGKLRKRAWMSVGDIILVSLRDFQDDKCDVIHKYTPEESHRLAKLGELESSEIESGKIEKNECAFTFDEI